MTDGGNLEAAVGIREGEVVAGKYRIEGLLGKGGMGLVVAAHHLQLDEKVAIKFLLPESLQYAEMVARFVREARAAAKIKSEHVARVSDVATLENGLPYMVMEFLDGMDLAARIRSEGRLPIELAVDFVLQASEAVAEAHALGIVHRDLKPGNLFVHRRPDGQIAIKVLDFGISKLTGSAATSNAAMTRTIGPMGSPLYMSPEQMHAASSVDVRTDIWALGIVLYEAIAGVPPFRGDTLPEVCAKILTNSPEPLLRVRADVPPGLDVVVLKCLEKDREKRFRDVAEMAAPLAPFGSESARISVRRISGVLSRSTHAGAPARPLPPIRTVAHEATFGAPPETYRAQSAAPTPAQLAGTGRPVANTMGARTKRPARGLAWTGVGILGFLGAAGAWMARGTFPPPGAVNSSAPAATRGTTETASVSTSFAVGSTSTVAPSVSSESVGVTAPATTPSSEAAPSTSSRAGSGASSASPPPRGRPHAETLPKSAAITLPSASVSGALSSPPPHPAAVSSASASNCHLVSSFDARGREHFTQVCDGN